MKKVVEKKEDGMLLRDYLTHILHLSGRLLKKVKATPDGITVNGIHQTVRYLVQAGDLVQIRMPTEARSSSMRATKMPLDIVYEDDTLLVINKQAGMPTIPSRLHPRETLANALLYYYEQKQLPFTVHIVTRLDKDTSGLVLVAKHGHSHALFAAMQERGEIKRKYLALVHGQVEEKQGKIEAPIGRKQDSIIERTVTDTGQYALTYYEVRQASADYTLVEVELVTGRTHQIRVHFAHIDHPLLGDDLYGGEQAMIKRQALHCHDLRFVHPITRENLHFTQALSKDMAEIIDI